ncbi:MAG: hypothetical protein EPN76_14925 [Burkholderiaceae bacterium]|nr:MAG: hypothetical protein EPN76_14925 [Burkholderiaceae bacterium]
MAKPLPFTNKEGEVRELKAGDFKRAESFGDLPKDLQDTLRTIGKRGPQRAPTKELITIRLSKDVVERFRATGPGWQSRVNEVLKKAVKAGVV